jgi:uncharacterized protein DUF4760
MADESNILTRIRFDLPITISTVCFFLLIVLTIWFWRESGSTKETLIFFGAGLAAVGQLAAAFYTARTLSAALNKEDRDITRERQRQALRFGERWNDSSMHNARSTLRAVVNAHAKSAEELKAAIDGNEVHVIHILNFLEEIATCCRYDLADVKLLREQFDFIVIKTWDTLLPWIQQHRRGNSVWEELEKLNFAWRPQRG